MNKEELVSATLANGDDFNLLGFGTFSTLKRATNTGLNPQTGESLKIATRIQPKFKAEKALKEAVNEI